ncbi:MAG: hypothetical protein DRR42_20515, partial [Gammaproteobacteria bacterium]
MGGSGSGRYCRIGAKQTTDDYLALDIRQLQRDDRLTPSRLFGWQGRSFRWRWWCNDEVIASIKIRVSRGEMTLSYPHQLYGEEAKEENYSVLFDWTECNFGGERIWFICPAKGCRRRAAILYGGSIFACRQCHGLVYPSQRESHGDRAARKANRIRDRLGWERGILNPKGWEKPKGMHWPTFDRLNRE